MNINKLNAGYAREYFLSLSDFHFLFFLSCSEEERERGGRPPR